MSLFPTYIENYVVKTIEEKAVVPREYEIDFVSGQLTGKIVEGKEAIKIWIWIALQTPRYRHYIYSWDYGSEFEELIGQGYTKEYIDTEVQRMTEECLLINENIQSINNFSSDMEGSQLTISFTANTIYGEIEFIGETIKVI